MDKTGATILIAMILLGGGIVFWKGYSGAAPLNTSVPGENISVSGGKQIVTVVAKGGYSPRISVAKANTPTTLRMITKGTFDCSIALRIPDLGYSKNLEPNSSLDIEIPPQKTGTNIQGFCSMGMYNFRIDFI